MFTVLTKSGTNFGHFALSVMYKIKPRDILFFKDTAFSRNPNQQPFWTNFEWKYTQAVGVVDNILQKVLRVHRLVQFPTVVKIILY